MSNESSHPSKHPDTASIPQNHNLQEHTQRLQDEALKTLNNASNKQLNEELARESIVRDETREKTLFKIKVSKNMVQDHSGTREIPEKDYPPPVHLIQNKNGGVTQLEFPGNLPNK